MDVEGLSYYTALPHAIENSKQTPLKLVHHIRLLAHYMHVHAWHARTCKAKEAKAKVAKSDVNKKITIYVRFSNAKALNTFCEVELQVQLNSACITNVCKCVTFIELADTLMMTITDLIRKKPKIVPVLIAAVPG